MDGCLATLAKYKVLRAVYREDAGESFISTSLQNHDLLFFPFYLPELLSTVGNCPTLYHPIKGHVDPLVRDRGRDSPATRALKIKKTKQKPVPFSSLSLH